MCHHKYRLTVLDKRFLARHGFTLYQCAQCETEKAQKLLPPKKEQEDEDDGA